MWGRNKQEKEFLAAYEKYADDIYRHCYFRVYNKELAEDLTQETFIKTWKYLLAGEEIKNIRAFLYKVAVNLVIDHNRKRKAVSLEEVEEKHPLKEGGAQVRQLNIEDKFFKRFEFGQLVSLLDELSDSQKQVMVMRYIDDLQPAEIAEILGESPNAVSVRINHATNNLRKILNSKHYDA